MKEYGGFIEFEYFHGCLYHPQALALNSGRHALEYLLRAKGLRKIYLPRFLCSSVADTCKKVGTEVAYYSINRQFLPEFSPTCAPGEAMYVVNYYGQLSDEQLLALQASHGNLIVDNAQAFFRKPLPGTDTLYTCRKFFGVADGGYLYSDGRLPLELEQDVSCQRMEFLMGRLEKTANEYYSAYAENNRHFASQPIKRMSRLTQNILQGLDYDRIANQRMENFARLHKAFRQINRLSLSVPEGAFMYPLYVENGERIRKALQQKKIYIPTLWPDVFALCEESSPEYDMARNILPLPVDQRYDSEDMNTLIQEVTQCINYEN